VSDVTASDVLRVAQEWIHPDAFTVVVVGDAGDVIGQLSGVAEEMEVYDVEGNRVS
jgi:hypothetical protein